jgi:hypothetical protein
MPPQQPYRLLDLINEILCFRAHKFRSDQNDAGDLAVRGRKRNPSRFGGQ